MANGPVFLTLFLKSLIVFFIAIILVFKFYAKKYELKWTEKLWMSILTAGTLYFCAGIILAILAAASVLDAMGTVNKIVYMLLPVGLAYLVSYLLLKKAGMEHIAATKTSAMWFVPSLIVTIIIVWVTYR